eukprot:evm.model.scf_162EXC.11 EVM.evm.TU.scf_162EXC.11   scf_162EXC:68504-69934(-)
MAGAAGSSGGACAALRWAWLALCQFAFATGALRIRGSRGGEKQARRSRSLGELQAANGGNRSFTMKEVALHDSPEDCWIVIRGKVYDVTEFGRVHPGGRVIYTQGGRDASDVFSCFHAAASWQKLAKLCIGDLRKEEEDSAILADFRKLRSALLAEGLFNSDKVFYAWKVTMNLAILTTAIATLVCSGDQWRYVLLSAFLLALFWQQCGWLAHDFCHHQVFKNRTWNNCFGYLIGDVWLGFSVDWWKNKHNQHHAVPNELDNEKFAVDPDIDTLPLLAWSADMLETLPDSAYRTLIRFQHLLFWPILCMARVVWLQQSFTHVLATSMKDGKAWQELSFLGLHYAWYFGVVLCSLSPWKAAAYLVLSQVLAGFMLSFAFVQSHNGMEIYSDSKDFVTSQIVSTRDITGTQWVNWFMGGLNYQIEHHLFPTLPRHNLSKVRQRVKELCAKHGLSYEECTMAVGTKRVMQQLIDVARCA